jgi:hypothetical protein
VTSTAACPDAVG